jgi:5-formyltetrahydrofolate cyclo-ligase
VSSDKAGWRRTMTQARRARSAADIAVARSAIRAHALRLCAARGWRTVAAYVPFGTEPGSVELLNDLVGARRRVLVPLVLPDLDLDWAPWEDGQPRAPLGVEAIATVEAAFVPALAVDHDGTRLGRGGGSYDRALARMPPDVVVAALLYDNEFVADLPRDPWDRPVSAVITPAGWHRIDSTRSGTPPS